MLAQDLHVGFQWGTGSYKMGELKEFNEYIEGQNILNTRQVDNYPNYYYYRPSLHLRFASLDLSFSYTYQSTGSRYSLMDFSGEYVYDTQIKAGAPSLGAAYILNPNSRFQISLYGEIGAYFTSLRLFNELVVNEITLMDETYHLKSVNGLFEPGFKLSAIVSMFEVFINLGYNLQFGGKGLHLVHDKEAWLYGRSQKEAVQADWTGYRLGLGIRADLSKLL